MWFWGGVILYLMSLLFFVVSICVLIDAMRIREEGEQKLDEGIELSQAARRDINEAYAIAQAVIDPALEEERKMYGL